jgi:hypothetical protein
MANAPSASFFALFKSLLRPDNADTAAKESARHACKWLTDNIGPVRRYTEGDECTLLGLVFDHWITHHEGPNEKIIEYAVAQTKAPGLMTLFADFKEGDMADHTGWVHHEPDDLPALFATMIAEFKTARVVRLMQNAITIAATGVELKRGYEKVLYKGSDDAIRYVWETVDSGVIGAPGGTPTHGSLTSSADRVGTLYDEKKLPGLGTKPQFTGLRELDKVIRPSRGMLIGVGGYAKAGKTRFGRGWNYKSICEGFNILHLTYEQTFDEELAMYAIIHSHNKALWGPDAHGKDRGLSYESWRTGCLTQAQEEFLKHELIPDLRDGKSLTGQLFIRQPEGDGSWQDALVQISLTNHTAPLDRVWIDYLAATASPSARDEQKEVNAIIQQAKTLAMTFDNHRGLIVASPFQINRDSMEKAGKADGKYEANCCYMYSQVEKALDVLYYVYNDDKLSQESCVQLGCCIHRQSKTVQPFRAAVQHQCGTFSDYRAEVSETQFDEVMDLL